MRRLRSMFGKMPAAFGYPEVADESKGNIGKITGIFQIPPYPITDLFKRPNKYLITRSFQIKEDCIGPFETGLAKQRDKPALIDNLVSTF